MRVEFIIIVIITFGTFGIISCLILGNIGSATEQSDLMGSIIGGKIIAL